MCLSVFTWLITSVLALIYVAVYTTSGLYAIFGLSDFVAWINIVHATKVLAAPTLPEMMTPLALLLGAATLWCLSKIAHALESPLPPPPPPRYSPPASPFPEAHHDSVSAEISALRALINKETTVRRNADVRIAATMDTLLANLCVLRENSSPRERAHTQESLQ
jgi:hypothetical protein